MGQSSEMQATSRFSHCAENYAKCRPSYPQAAVDELVSGCELRFADRIADVGAGTGIMAAILLTKGFAVDAVEPNGPMRAALMELRNNYPQLRVSEGSAEQTNLPDGSVDLVVVAQAFHWFDPFAARREFARILKPNGAVALLWNIRDTQSTQFLREMEKLLLEYSSEYAALKATTINMPILERFFGATKMVACEFANHQRLDYDALYGLVRSMSFVPQPDHPRFDAMSKQLQTIFRGNADDGTVEMRYSCKLFYGRLSHEVS
jgi:SAM-dependent methyltransferase